MSTINVNTIRALTGNNPPEFHNNSGAAVGFLPRAWVQYDATDNSITGSGNVSSVTDNATGDFTMNFTTAMPDANYGCFGACGYNDTNPNIGITNQGTSADPTTTALRWCVCVNFNSNLSDEKRITMAIIR